MESLGGDEERQPPMAGYIPNSEEKDVKYEVLEIGMYANEELDSESNRMTPSTLDESSGVNEQTTDVVEGINNGDFAQYTSHIFSEEPNRRKLVEQGQRPETALKMPEVDNMVCANIESEPVNLEQQMNTNSAVIKRSVSVRMENEEDDSDFVVNIDEPWYGQAPAYSAYDIDAPSLTSGINSTEPIEISATSVQSLINRPPESAAVIKLEAGVKVEPLIDGQSMEESPFLNSAQSWDDQTLGYAAVTKSDIVVKMEPLDDDYLGFAPMENHCEGLKAELETDVCECSSCGNIFTRRGSLFAYVQYQKKDPTEDPYSCACCTENFHSRFDTMNHAFRKHEGSTVVDEEKFECPFCLRIFGRKELFAHTEKHRYENPDNWQKEHSSDQCPLHGMHGDIENKYLCPDCTFQGYKHFVIKEEKLKENETGLNGILEAGKNPNSSGTVLNNGMGNVTVKTELFSGDTQVNVVIGTLSIKQESASVAQPAEQLDCSSSAQGDKKQSVASGESQSSASSVQGEKGKIASLINELKLTVKSETTKSECVLCKESVETKVLLTDYIFEVQDKSTFQSYFWCIECSTVYCLLREAILHVFGHHKGCHVSMRGKCLQYTCPLCNIKFLSKRKFVVHLGKHSNPLLSVKVNGDSSADDSTSAQKYLCPDCYSKNNSNLFKAKLVEVISGETKAVTNGDVAQPYDLTCPKCSREFETKYKRYSHVQKCMSLQWKKLLKAKCEYCGWRFDNKRPLLAHIKRNHPEFYKESVRKMSDTIESEHYICDVCDKVFRFEYLLEVHQNSCSQLNQPKRRTVQKIRCNFEDQKEVTKVLKCTFRNCTTTVRTFVELYRHTFLAHQELVRCPRCQIFLNTLGFRDDHISMCKSAFKCRKCEHYFDTLADLDDHNCAKKAETIPLKEDAISYETKVCFACDEEFQRKAVESYCGQMPDGSCQCVDCHITFSTRCEAIWHAYSEHTGIEIVGDHKNMRYFLCYLCSRKIRKKQHLEAHIRDHDQLEYTCKSRDCAWKFKEQEEMELHPCPYPDLKNVPLLCLQRLYQTSKQGLVCGKCIKYFEGPPTIPRWNKKCFKFRCEHCVKHFRSKRDFLKHKLDVHGVVNQKRIYYCPKCEREFDRHKIMQAHTQNHAHLKCKCSECGWEFESAKALGSHVHNAHKNRLSGFILRNCALALRCSTCNCAFATSRVLNEHHLLTQHAPTDDSLNKALPLYLKLKLQKSKKTGEWLKEATAMTDDQQDEMNLEKVHKTFECKFCSFVYVSQESLDHHIVKDHAKEFKKCPLCPKMFDNAKSLKFHVIRVHDDRNVLGLGMKSAIKRVPQLKASKGHKCNRCWRMFSRARDLKQHKLRKHQKTWPGLDSLRLKKTLKCLVCQRSFKNPEDLKSHFICAHEIPVDTFLYQHLVCKSSESKPGKPKRSRSKYDSVSEDSELDDLFTSAGERAQRPIRKTRIKKASVVLERLPDSVLEKYMRPGSDGSLDHTSETERDTSSGKPENWQRAVVFVTKLEHSIGNQAWVRLLEEGSLKINT